MRPLLAGVALVTLASTASSQPTTAERLFNEGLALLDAGKAAEACAKFEESLARDPRQLGAMLNLAECNKKQGKIATALKHYRAARDLAIEAKKDRSRATAEAQIAELEPDVPRVVFVRDRAAYPGEKLVFDDAVVSPTEQLTPDPGEHTITLTAPGRLPYETKVTIEIRERREIKLPALDVPKSSITTRETSSRRGIGKTLVISGGVATLASVGFVFLVKRDYDALFAGPNPHCGRYPDVDGKPTCDDYGLSISDRDRKLAIGGWVVGGLGAAIAVAGVVLWTTSPSETSRTRIVPTLDANGASVFVQREVRW